MGLRGLRSQNRRGPRADQSMIGIVTRITRMEYAVAYRIRDARSGAMVDVEQSDLRMGANVAWSRGVRWLIENRLLEQRGRKKEKRGEEGESSLRAAGNERVLSGKAGRRRRRSCSPSRESSTSTPRARSIDQSAEHARRMREFEASLRSRSGGERKDSEAPPSTVRQTPVRSPTSMPISCSARRRRPAQPFS